MKRNDSNSETGRREGEERIGWDERQVEGEKRAENIEDGSKRREC